MSTATARRPSPRIGREQRIEDILAAAREVFTEHGYHATAVSEIAARCGIVEGTIYKYFDSKRMLMSKVLERWYESLFGDIGRELRGLEGTRARLRHLVWRHLTTIQDDPKLARLTFLEVRSETDYRGSDLYRLNRRYTSMLEQTIRDGIARGELRAEVSPRTVRDLVYGGIEHLSWNFVSGHGGLDVDRRTDELVALVWGGIAAAGPAAADAADAPLRLQREVARLAVIADRLESATPGAGDTTVARRRPAGRTAANTRRRTE